MRMTINTFEVHERYFQKGMAIPIRVERAKKPNSRIKQQTLKLNDNINIGCAHHLKKQQRSVSVAAFEGAAIAQPPE
ncbi:beta-amylase, partial [Trifolium pratense]